MNSFLYTSSFMLPKEKRLYFWDHKTKLLAKQALFYRTCLFRDRLYIYLGICFIIHQKENLLQSSQDFACACWFRPRFGIFCFLEIFTLFLRLNEQSSDLKSTKVYVRNFKSNIYLKINGPFNFKFVVNNHCFVLSVPAKCGRCDAKPKLLWCSCCLHCASDHQWDCGVSE